MATQPDPVKRVASRSIANFLAKMVPPDYSGQVPALKEKFNEQFAESIKDGTFDSRDVEVYNKNDTYFKNFLRSNSGKEPETLTHIERVLKWRKEYGVNDLTREGISKEVWDRDGLVYKGKDKEGHKILHFTVAKHKKDSKLDEDVKKMIAFQFNEHYKEFPGEKIIVIFDFYEAGISNMDLDITKFIISCVTDYYPGILAYILNYEMPFLLNAIWKVIKGWLSKEQNDYVKMVKKKDISIYLDEEINLLI